MNQSEGWDGAARANKRERSGASTRLFSNMYPNTRRSKASLGLAAKSLNEHVSVSRTADRVPIRLMLERITSMLRLVERYERHFRNQAFARFSQS